MYNVYLFQCEGHYKIGYTKRKIENRRKELKTGNSNEIVLIHNFHSKFGIKIESRLHMIHKSKRIDGEWFKLSKEDVDNFLNECQNSHDTFDFLSKNNNYIIEKKLL